MSTIRYSRGGLSVSTYAGPAGHRSPNTNSRVMVQITTRGGQWVALTMDHWVDLVCFVRELDRQGIGITNAPEVHGDES